jgi:nucleotide-binding universal stress UspA family protein
MTPFPRVLVPYDGSEPARAALLLAIALARGGSELRILTVVSQASATDTATLAEAEAQCRSAGVEPTLECVRGRPVPEILAACDTHVCNIIVMGTHARSGAERLFVGSVTDGVLRSAPVPVITVRTIDHVAQSPLARAVVAIGNSAASDAVLAVAAILALDEHTTLIACHAVDMSPIYLDSEALGMNADDLIAALRDDGRMDVERALSRAALPARPVIEVVDGDPAPNVIKAAHRNHATIVIAGRHGRRDFLGTLLGNVAESLVRSSDIPVLIVPPIREQA